MTVLDQSRWQQIDAILDDVMDLPVKQQQLAVKKLCRGDADLYREVLEFLDQTNKADGTNSLLERNALQIANTFFAEQTNTPLIPPQSDSLKGMQVGAYILESEIGRGGMGVVYKARRTKGDFEQIAAIKLMMYTNVAVEERFRREQQALASLRHPNITQLFDGGISEQGYPYLVMEYIDGQPITDFCKHKQLGLNERLSLLGQVLSALAFSHKNLIVHRDIKPSNILVTEQGQVKLLDFSIAKLMDTSLDLEQTATHFQLFTPGYSAPEQLLNKPVTVATDIYQLGLLFFRLLTGHPPFKSEATSLPELVNIICNQDVSKPSNTVLRKVNQEESLPNLQHWSRQLLGDLDAIILKMLRKEPDARYPSIESLAADLNAYRNHLPVSARKAVLSYQVGKYLRRKWKAMALSGVAATVVLGYAVTVTEQNKRITTALNQAELEQRKAQQVTKFLSETFEAADPNEGGLEGITAQDLLEQARTRINDELTEAPDIRASLMNIFSVIYFRQQDYKKADALLTDLLEDPVAVQKMDPFILAEAKLRLAMQKMGMGDYPTAAQLIQESLALQSTLEDQKNTQKQLILGQTYAFGGLIDLRMQKRDSALPAIQKSIDILAALGNEGDDMRAFALNILATDQYYSNQLDLAIKNMYQVVELKKKAKSNKASEISRIEISLANMLLDQNRLPEAKNISIDATNRIKKYLPRDHPYQIIVTTLLSRIELRMGRINNAYHSLIKTIEETKSNPNNIAYFQNIILYIEVLLEMGDFIDADKAISEIEEIIGISEITKFQKTRIDALKGRLKLYEGDFDSALLYFELSASKLGEGDGFGIFVKRDKAIALFLLERLSQSEKEISELFSDLINRYDKKHPQVAMTCKIWKKITSHSNGLHNKVCDSVQWDEHSYSPNYLNRLLSGNN